MEKILIGVLGVLVLISILSVIFTLKLKKKRVHNVIQGDTLELNGDVSQKYPSMLLPVSKEGNRYTLAFSIYSENLAENSNWGKGFRTPKGIISHYGSPNVYYITDKNTLRISIAYRDDLSNKTFYNFDLENFKYQRWEHVAIVVDDRFVSVYLNGEIEKTTKLPNVPWVSQNSLFIGQKNNNFKGKIRNVEYFNDALNVNEVENLYKSNN